MESDDPLQINNVEPRLSSTTLVRGETQILQLRPTVPVLCPSGYMCSLFLNLKFPTQYCETGFNDLPFASQACGVFITGHIHGTDMNNYLRTPNNLTVYGKVKYQIGGIDTRSFNVFLHSEERYDNRLFVWKDFTIQTTVSINTHVSFE